MGIEIQGATNPALQREAALRESHGRHDLLVEHLKTQQKQASPQMELHSAVEKLQNTFLIFNKRLSFSVNEAIDRIVVKVIDTETDKVVKEIPPAEIQKLVARIEEAIGLLVDETI